MDNKELMKAIEWFQKQEDFHQLTCKNDSHHDPLVPKVEESAVVLVCPTCGHVQKKIPTIIEKLYKKMVR